MEAIEIKENAVYTFEEVCRILKTSNTNLRRKLKEGVIRFTKFGNQYRFLGKDILEFLQGTNEKKVEEFFKWLDDINKQNELSPIVAEQAAKFVNRMRKSKERKVA